MKGIPLCTIPSLSRPTLPDPMTFSTQLLWISFLLRPGRRRHLNTYLWEIAHTRAPRARPWPPRLTTSRSSRATDGSSCFSRSERSSDSDRFITSFLIQKCDSFTSLYVFSEAPSLRLVCKRCCIMLVYVLTLAARNQRRQTVLSGRKDLNFNILLHKTAEARRLPGRQSRVESSKVNICFFLFKLLIFRCRNPVRLPCVCMFVCRPSIMMSSVVLSPALFASAFQCDCSSSSPKNRTFHINNKH